MEHNAQIVKATGKNASNGVMLRSSDGVDFVTGWSVYANTEANSEGKGFVHCDLSDGTSLSRVAHGLSFASSGSKTSLAVSEVGFGSALVALRNHGMNFGKAGWKAIREEWKAFCSPEAHRGALTNLVVGSGFVVILPAYRDADDANQPDYSGRDHLTSLFSGKAAKGIEAQGVGKVTAAYDLGNAAIVGNLVAWDAMEIDLLPAEQSRFSLPETTTMGALCDAIAKRSGAKAIPYSETRGDDFVTSVEAQADDVDFSL